MFDSFFLWLHSLKLQKVALNVCRGFKLFPFKIIWSFCASEFALNMRSMLLWYNILFWKRDWILLNGRHQSIVWYDILTLKCFDNLNINEFRKKCVYVRSIETFWRRHYIVRISKNAKAYEVDVKTFKESKLIKNYKLLLIC